MNAVLLQLQIEIRIRESTRTPMLQCNDVARLRREFGSDLAAPRTGFKGLALPSCFLYRRDVLPGLVVARTISMMKRVEDSESRVTRGAHNPEHVRNTTIRFRNRLDPVPQ